jgi:hypothetical protein
MAVVLLPQAEYPSIAIIIFLIANNLSLDKAWVCSDLAFYILVYTNHAADYSHKPRTEQKVEAQIT